MVRVTIDNAKDYIGKVCLVPNEGCFLEDKIIMVDSHIHLEHYRSRDVVYVLNVLEICGPLQKDRVKVGDKGVFFNLIGDLCLISTYKVNTVDGISNDTFYEWPYLTNYGVSYRYFLPMEEPVL